MSNHYPASSAILPTINTFYDLKHRCKLTLPIVAKVYFPRSKTYAAIANSGFGYRLYRFIAKSTYESYI